MLLLSCILQSWKLNRTAIKNLTGKRILLCRCFTLGILEVTGLNKLSNKDAVKFQNTRAGVDSVSCTVRLPVKSKSLVGSDAVNHPSIE